VYPDSHDLNFSNRPVRTRTPGGVGGVRSIMTGPYPDRLPGDARRPMSLTANALKHIPLQRQPVALRPDNRP
jgi:hypothetical protein